MFPQKLHHATLVATLSQVRWLGTMLKSSLRRSGVLLVCFVAVLGNIACSPPQQLGANLCSQGSIPNQHHVAFIDKTDDYTSDQQRAMEAQLRQHHQELKTGDRLTLVLLTPDAKDSFSQVLFDRCRPPSREEANPLISNPQKIGKRFETAFVAPFEAALQVLREVQPADASPLLETIYGLAHSAELSEPAARQRYLFFYSDMLQNSTVLSHFKPNYRFDQLATGRSMYLDVASLRGAEVTVNRVGNRHRLLQTDGQIEFWKRYFDHAHVAKLTFREL